MTIKMKNKVNIDDFLTLIFWVKTFFLLDGKKFNYQNLLDQAETYKLNGTPLDTQIHHIDDLMIDAFKVYHKLKQTEDKVNEAMNHIQVPFISKEMMMNETKKYHRVFEDLIENYQYNDPEICGIQMGFLQEKMREFVAVEDYDNANKIEDLLINYKYDDTKRSIQKSILSEKMKELVEHEEYEKCAKVRDLLKEF